MARKSKSPPRGRAARRAERPRHRRELIPMPKRPYRDSAIFHLALGSLLLLVAWLTGGEITRALVWAGLYVVLAISWSWWRFRQRLQREAEAVASPPAETNGGRRR